jgi:hypothetical protein
MGVLSPGKLGRYVVNFQRLGCVTNSHMSGEAVLGLEWSDWGCHFSVIFGICRSARPYCVSQAILLTSAVQDNSFVGRAVLVFELRASHLLGRCPQPGWESLSISKPWFSAIGFPNLLSRPVSGIRADSGDDTFCLLRPALLNCVSVAGFWGAFIIFHCYRSIYVDVFEHQGFCPYFTFFS